MENDKIQVHFPIEIIAIQELKPHPRNYREHPDDQLEHIIESIKTSGFYRNIVIADDGTILAGHGVVKAATVMGLEEIPVKRLPIGPDTPQALKILTGDNEISGLGVIDDRQLTTLLKEIKDIDLTGLLGTGFDDMMLANLVFVTRNQSEIEDFDHAAHWVGMPDYEKAEESLKLIIHFRSHPDREKFVHQFKLEIMKREAKTWTTWWPMREIYDTASVRYEVNGKQSET
jgi:hypothetical protein